MRADCRCGLAGPMLHNTDVSVTSWNDVAWAEVCGSSRECAVCNVTYAALLGRFSTTPASSFLFAHVQCSRRVVRMQQK